jgi:hypothetical protein
VFKWNALPGSALTASQWHANCTLIEGVFATAAADCVGLGAAAASFSVSDQAVLSKKSEGQRYQVALLKADGCTVKVSPLHGPSGAYGEPQETLSISCGRTGPPGPPVAIQPIMPPRMHPIVLSPLGSLSLTGSSPA